MTNNYFPHDYNAKNDQKILMLRSEYGIRGYGLFWFCIESMAEDTNGFINREAIGGLSVSYGITKEELTKFLDYCLAIKILKEDKMGIYSPRMMQHKLLRKTLSEAGKKGANNRWSNREANGEAISPPYAKKERKKERKKEIYTSNLKNSSKSGLPDANDIFREKLGKDYKKELK